MGVFSCVFLVRNLGGNICNEAGCHCSSPKPEIRRNTLTETRHELLSPPSTITAYLLLLSSFSAGGWPVIYSLLSTAAIITTLMLWWLIKVRAKAITSSRLQRCSFVGRVFNGAVSTERRFTVEIRLQVDHTWRNTKNRSWCILKQFFHYTLPIKELRDIVDLY
jgi:hypothetical protein